MEPFEPYAPYSSYQSKDTYTPPRVHHKGHRTGKDRSHRGDREHPNSVQCSSGLFDSLSEELVLLIASQLCVKDIVFGLGATCRRLRRLLCDGPVWRRRYFARWMSFEDVARPCYSLRATQAPWPSGDWRGAYLVRHRFEIRWNNPARLRKRELGWQHVPHPTRALALAGQLLLTAGDDHLVRLWDLQSANRLRALKAHSGPILALAHDKDSLFSASFDGSLRIWDLDSLACKQTLRTHDGPVRQVGVLRGTSNAILTGGDDGETHLVCLPSGKVSRAFRTSPDIDPVCSLSTHPHEPLFATGSKLGVCVIWDPDRAVALHTWRPHLSFISNPPSIVPTLQQPTQQLPQQTMQDATLPTPSQNEGSNENPNLNPTPTLNPIPNELLLDQEQDLHYMLPPIDALVFDENPNLVYTSSAARICLWDSRTASLADSKPVRSWLSPTLKSSSQETQRTCCTITRHAIVLGLAGGQLQMFDPRSEAVVWSLQAARAPITALTIQPHCLAFAAQDGSLVAYDGPLFPLVEPRGSSAQTIATGSPDQASRNSSHNSTGSASSSKKSTSTPSLSSSPDGSAVKSGSRNKQSGSARRQSSSRNSSSRGVSGR